MLPLPIISNTYKNPPEPILLTGTFTQMPNSTSPRRTFGYCSDRDNGMFYILYGYDGGNPGLVNTFVRYNPTDKTFTTLSNSGIPVGNGYTMQYFGGKIYANLNSSTMYVYDISTNSWSSKIIQNYPGAWGWYCHSAVTTDGIMYIQGGYGQVDLNYNTRFYSYNIATNTMQALTQPAASTIAAGGYSSDLVTDGTNLYLVAANGLFKYTVQTNSWQQLSTDTKYGRMCYVNNSLYMLNAYSTLRALYKFNFGTSIWEQIGTEATRRYMGCLLSASNESSEIYSIAGGTSTNTYNGNVFRIT